MTGRSRGMGAARLRYHRGGNLLLFGLTLLVLLTAVAGPLCERAVEQAATRSTLVGADRVGRGLVLTAADPTAPDTAPPSLPGRLWGTPVGSLDVPTDFRFGSFLHLTTTISYRDDECAHLTFARGSCPAGDDEVAVSTSTATATGLTLGDRIAGDTRVVGLYRPFSPDDDYWFGHEYSSSTGIYQNRDGVFVDALFATATFTAALAQQQVLTTTTTSPRREVDIPLRADRVVVDDIPALRHVLATATATATATANAGGPAAPGGDLSLSSALGSYLDRIDRARHDARVVVAAIAVQLTLLALVTFGVVVAAAADARRPELALVRLRGRGSGAAARQCGRELGAVVAAAVVPGVALGWVVASVMGARLGEGARAEPRWPVAAAAGVAFVAAVATVAVVVRRTSRGPVTDLLRRVPLRSGRGRGLTEAAVGAVAVAGLVASGGSPGGALAVVTPTCVAALVGLLAARLMVLAAPRIGRRALRRRDVATAVAAFGVARRPGARLTAAVVCVATAFVVFAGQQYGVAATARAQRAGAETGAAVVLGVATAATGPVRQALRAVDPAGTWATPVVVVQPAGTGAEPLVAVEPRGFAAVATWGRAGLRPPASALAALAPPGLAPSVVVTGTSAGLALTDVSWAAVAAPEPGLGRPTAPSVGLALDLVHADGRTTAAALGPLPRAAAGPLQLTAPVSCSDGCRVTGLTVTRPALDSTPVQVSFTVTGVGSTPPTATAAVPRASDWASVTKRHDVPGADRPTSMAVAGGTGGVRFTAVDDGRGAAAQYLDRPVAAPGLVAGPPPASRDALGYALAAGPYGDTTRVRPTGPLSFVPGVGGPAVLVDLDLLAFDPRRLDVGAHVEVWTRTHDPAREAALTAALQRGGVTVVTRATAAAARDAAAHTAPAWSTDLALAAAGFAELFAVLLVVLVVTASRRSRREDLAALRLVGVTRRRLRRSTALELLALVLTGVVAGTLAGVAGARIGLPGIPVFTAAPTVPIAVTYPLQATWLAAAVGLGLVLLAPTAILSGRRTTGSRGDRPDRRRPTAAPAGPTGGAHRSRGV